MIMGDMDPASKEPMWLQNRLQKQSHPLVNFFLDFHSGGHMADYQFLLASEFQHDLLYEKIFNFSYTDVKTRVTRLNV